MYRAILLKKCQLLPGFKAAGSKVLNNDASAFAKHWEIITIFVLMRLN